MTILSPILESERVYDIFAIVLQKRGRHI